MRLSRTISLAVGLPAVVLMLLMACGPRNAAAAESPFKIQFDSSEIQFGAIQGLPLDALSTKATLEGTIDENGTVTIPKGGFNMPELGIAEPIAIKGFMGIESPATGTFDAATGRLELDTTAGIWVSVNIQQVLAAAEGLGFDLGDSLGELTPFLGLIGKDLTCGFAPMDMHFSTEPNSLATGTRFVGGPGGTGALSAEWSKLGPFAGRTKVLGLIDVCQILQDQLPTLLEGLGGTGTGGLDLGGLLENIDLNDLDDLDLGPSAITLTKAVPDPPAPPDDPGPGPGPGGPADPGPPPAAAQLKLTVTPKKKRARAGSKVRYRASVQNVGGSTADGVEVCVKVPKKAAKVKPCRDLGRLVAGAKKTREFKFRLKGSATPRSYRIAFRTGSASGGKKPQALTRLRIR